MKIYFFKSCFLGFNNLRKIGINIKTSNLEKEYLVAKALSTDEGRRALSEAMIGPITCNMPKYVYTDEELERGNFS